MGIRKPTHPILFADGKQLEIRAAIFDLTNKEKEIFCSVFKNVKLPYGCASNFSRYVHINERKIQGYKSHDAHFILRNLLQIAMKKTSKPEFVLPLIRMSTFIRGLWNKVITLDDVKKMQEQIIELLCQFEMIFTSSFFNIMVHFLFHLCKKVKYGGPEHLRNMFPIERYLGKLKSYVRNRCKLEGSIAEGYLAEECVTFCSRFLSDDGAKENSMYSHPIQVECHIGTRRNKDGKIFQLKDVDWKACHRYILFNSGNDEIEKLIEDHRALMYSLANSERYKRARTHTEEFSCWLKEEVGKRGNISRELEVLALGPNRTTKRFTGYLVNGYIFHIKLRDSKCITQISGVYLTAETTSFTTLKDEKPIVGNVNYYRSIEEIIEVDYWGEFTVVLFRCYWYQEEKDPYGLTRVNFNKLCQKSNPYVLDSEVEQVFYVEDPTKKMVHYVIKKLLKDWCDTENDNASEKDMNNHELDDIDTGRGLKTHVEINWSRDDVPTKHIPIQEI